jgi:hypothetical protein
MTTALDEVSSTQRFKEVTINEDFEAVSAAGVYGVHRSVTEGLTWGYYGGRWGGFSVADGTLTLTNAADNYIVVLRSTGAISISTSSTNWDNTQLYARVYKITVAGSVVTALEDHRAGPGGVLGPSATTVSGPSSATDHAVARWDLTTGKLLQNSVVTISDLGAIAGAISLTIASGALTDSAPAVDVTQTWNDAADAFVGADTNITDTNSHADSVIERWRVGGTVLMAIGKANIRFGTGGPQTVSNSVAARVQIVGTNIGASSLQGSNWANDDNSGVIEWAKAKSGTVGTHGAVVSGTDLMRISASGSDGAGFFQAARIVFEAEGTVSTGVVPGRVLFLTANASGVMTEVARFDSSQKVLAGLTTALTIGQSNKVQIAGNATTNGGLSLSRFSADAVGTKIEFSKSRSGTVGTNTIAQSGDDLGSITWYGADGTNYDAAAQIIGEVDGTPGSGTDMPGRLRFLTSANATATLTERMRIDNAGNVIVNTAAIATTATDGFLYIPSCAGTPTGVPTAYTGLVPCVVNSSANKWYFYSGGAWRDAGP